MLHTVHCSCLLWWTKTGSPPNFTAQSALQGNCLSSHWFGLMTQNVSNFPQSTSTAVAPFDSPSYPLCLSFPYLWLSWGHASLQPVCSLPFLNSWTAGRYFSLLFVFLRIFSCLFLFSFLFSNFFHLSLMVSCLAPFVPTWTYLFHWFHPPGCGGLWEGELSDLGCSLLVQHYHPFSLLSNTVFLLQHVWLQAVHS